LISPTDLTEPNRRIGFKQLFFGIIEVVNRLCLLSINYFKVVQSVHGMNNFKIKKKNYKL
jgi:hypothetical protein